MKLKKISIEFVVNEKDFSFPFLFYIEIKIYQFNKVREICMNRKKKLKIFICKKESNKRKRLKVCLN